MGRFEDDAGCCGASVRLLVSRVGSLVETAGMMLTAFDYCFNLARMSISGCQSRFYTMGNSTKKSILSLEQYRQAGLRGYLFVKAFFEIQRTSHIHIY
jgi:hypothetical protein